MTLSTLREMGKSISVDEMLDEPEIDGLATVAATFYDLLASIRPELGRMSQPDRKRIRHDLVVDAAVMMHGYAALIQDFNTSIGVRGVTAAIEEWASKLRTLSAKHVYSFDRWKGDLFEKRNPLWQKVGVVKPGRDGKPSVLNTGSARGECGRVLRQLVAAGHAVSDLLRLTT